MTVKIMPWSGKEQPLPASSPTRNALADGPLAGRSLWASDFGSGSTAGATA